MGNFNLLIDGTAYTKYTQVGIIVNDTMTEELDSCTAILTGINERQFEPFTDVVVKTPESDALKYFYINTNMNDLCNYDKDKHSYTINMVSQTKILERVYLPNLKIRKSLSGTAKSIYKYLLNVVLPYINKQFPFISLSGDLITLTSGVEVPEMEWNHPNAKQVINDLLMTIPGNPCVVRMTANQISYLSLAQKGNDITDKEKYPHLKIVNSSEHQDMSEFADSIVLDASGIVPSNSNIKETLSPRSSQTTGYLTTENAQIHLSQPIEKINSVHIYVYAKAVDSSGNTLVEKDLMRLNITDHIKETAEYETYLSGNYSNTTRASDVRKYKFLYLSYNYGSKIIDNLGYKITDVGSEVNDQDKALNKIASYRLRHISKEELIDNGYSGNNTWKWYCYEADIDIREIVFDVEYGSIQSNRIRVTKDEREAKKVSFYQSQNQNQINLDAFLRTQKDAVNRLGNETINLSLMCGLDSIPKLADYYKERYILSQRQIAYYNDFAMVNATFTKDYIQKNVYYGITTKRKFTQLAQSNEATIREEHDLYHVVISATKEEENLETLDENIASYFSGNDEPVLVVGFITDSMYSNGQKEATLYPSILGAEKSVIISIQMDDNYNIGMKTTIDDKNYIQDYVQYVDSYGEITSYNLKLYTKITEDKTSIDTCRSYPDIAMGDKAILKVSKVFYKDNGETLKSTLQFNFESGDDDIIIGDTIGEHNMLVESGKDVKLKIGYSRSEYMSRSYPVKTASTEIATDITLKVTGNMVYFTEPNDWEISQNPVLHWVILDSNDNVILAVNRSEDNNLKTKFYINTKGE